MVLTSPTRMSAPCLSYVLNMDFIDRKKHSSWFLPLPVPFLSFFPVQSRILLLSAAAWDSSGKCLCLLANPPEACWMCGKVFRAYLSFEAWLCSYFKLFSPSLGISPANYWKRWRYELCTHRWSSSVPCFFPQYVNKSWQADLPSCGAPSVSVEVFQEGSLWKIEFTDFPHNFFLFFFLMRS